MRTIIQLSDFHINVTMPMPEHNNVFVGLIQKIKQLELQDLILVYNGDVVDWSAINSKIDYSLPLDQKAQCWDIEAHKAYELARKYFTYLIRELSISRKKIIICCGNHDVNSYYENTEELPCPRTDQEVFYNPCRFKEFSYFCDQIQERKNTAGTYFREIDGINFLVANSNWVNKWGPKGKMPLCIDCKGIDQEIEKRKIKLTKTKEEKSNLLNIFVAHAPRMDYCEYSLFPYKENCRNAIMTKVDRMFGLKLYGDKHSTKLSEHDYIVGAPLNEDYITCGIHQFDQEYHHHFISLVYDKDRWEFFGSENDIEQILKISKESIKTQTLKYLFGSKSTSDLAEKIKHFETTRSGIKWNELDKLIRSYAEIQKTKVDGPGSPVSADDGFINTLIHLASNSTKRVSITLRGEARLGKSVCMSLLYMSMLHKFVCGTYEYMPVYLNLEQIMSGISVKNRDSKKFLISLRKNIVEKLTDGMNLARRLQKPACCLVDGINMFYLYNNAHIEDLIDELFEGEEGSQYQQIIYCIDTVKNSGLGFTPQHTRKDAEYVVYFKRILTKKVNSKKKYKNFIKAFCALQDEGTASVTSQNIFDNIDRMQIMEVDTGLLVNFWEYLSVKNDNSFFSLLDQFVYNTIDVREMNAAAKASFLYYNRGFTYTEIKQKCSIRDSTFELIRTQDRLAKYLIALNYVNHICTEKVKIELNSCLNELYNHEICVLIREYINKRAVQSQVLNFARNRYNDLSFEGKATISYLLGRIDCRSQDVLGILKAQQNFLSADKTNFSGTLSKNIARRSIRLSRLFKDKNGCEQLCDYLRILISDENERKTNRMFYLQFYGDRDDCNEDSITEGFDVFNTYHILASRLAKWKKSQNRYTLLDLELFTLCDLIQVRLDTPYARSSDCGKSVHSFFYSISPKDQMAINVLSFLIGIIDQYILLYGNLNNRNTIFVKYLRMQSDSFVKARNIIQHGSLEITRNSYSPAAILQQLTELENVKRIGWAIKEVPSGRLTEDEYSKLKEETTLLESTLHHTYEAFLIAMLYLPKASYTDSEYNKQKVLDMILIHDLGESIVGDLIPAYEHYDEGRRQEKEFCENLFLQGVHSGMADLSHYFFLWEKWCGDEKEDHNIAVAKDIDKIQMLYKLLVLLKDEKVVLSPERVNDFWDSKNRIQTNEGMKIFNLLISNNPSFIKVAETHCLSLSPLYP